MRYRISEQAANDLENIWLYTFETWSIKQADKYFALLMNEIEYVSENPELGKDYDHIRKGYFKSSVESHFIFYKINNKDNVVEIIRILHHQMDIDERLHDNP